MNDAVFITTKDRETAKILESQGFQKIEASSDRYVFLQCKGVKFSKSIDVSKIKYTNILHG